MATASTATPTITPSPTTTPNLTATQQYDDFIALVQKLHDAGQISSTEGTYHNWMFFRPNGDGLWLSLKSYRNKRQGFHSSREFDWEVANDKIIPGAVMCLSRKSDQYYYLISLDAINGIFLSYTKDGISSSGVSGVVNYTLAAAKKMKFPDMGANPYHAAFTLIVNDNIAYTYVNDDFFTEQAVERATG